MVVLATLAVSSIASADIMLNGVGYDADQLCFDGTYLEAQVTKTRNLYRENGQGDLIVVGKVTVEAGDKFMWRRATSFADNGQGDSVPVHFDRNGNPVDIQVIKTGSDENEETTVIKTPVPAC